MHLSHNIEVLFKKIEALSSEVDMLRKRVKELEYFEKENARFKRDNAILKDKLAKYKNPKNSNNSSLPPSKDENRPFKSKSLRKKTGQKPYTVKKNSKDPIVIN